MNCCKHKYFVIYRGDDTDFPGNQELIVELNTERDLTGCSAHFSFQGFTQDFDEIPSDKKLHLIFPSSETKKFALGASDAKLWLTYGRGTDEKTRTVENRIHVVVTNNVDEAYDNDDPQAITVTISGGGGGATVVLDDTVTEESANGVKSSGIWSWVKSLLPHWLTSDYAEPATVASVANKRDMDDRAVYKLVKSAFVLHKDGLTDITLPFIGKDQSKPYPYSEYDWVYPIGETTSFHAIVFSDGQWKLNIDDGMEYGYSSASEDALRIEFDNGYVATRSSIMSTAPVDDQQLAAVATDDASKPADGDLMKYDAANDRFVKATASDIPELPYLSTKNGGTVDGYVVFNKLVVFNGEIQPATVRAMAGDVIATVDGNIHNLSYKADRATTLAGYGITDGATKESIAPEYFETSAYSVGAIVYHDGNIYQCKTAIAEGGEAWNAEHWELRKLDDFFTESNGLLNGRLAYSRNATGLKDRAFNALTFDGTEYNLSTALAAVTPTASGQPRDLLIVATATAATTISFTAGTIKGDKPTIDGSGTWLITLTEYASGVWYCRQIKMEDAA